MFEIFGTWAAMSAASAWLAYLILMAFVNNGNIWRR